MKDLSISGNCSHVSPLVALLCLTFLFQLPSLALGEGDYEISWSSIDGGGGRGSGGQYTLMATIGQPDASWGEGGNYELLGGFLPGSVEPGLLVLTLNGGETLRAWETHEITWDSWGDDPITDVEIQYSDDNGNSWIPIESSTENDGQSILFIPGSSTYRLPR